MTRIIAGHSKGRLLEVPKKGTRPTSDKVREALFSYLDHAGYLDDTVVLDLFAGSGALGIEAASRGARSVTLVENARGAIETIQRNIASLDIADQVALVAATVEQYLAKWSRITAAEKVDLVMIDPPYGWGNTDLDELLQTLSLGPLAADALVLVERDGRSPEPKWPQSWRADGARVYGGTTIWLAGP